MQMTIVMETAHY